MKNPIRLICSNMTITIMYDYNDDDNYNDDNDDDDEEKYG